MTRTAMKILEALKNKGYGHCQEEYDDFLAVKHGKKTADEIADKIIRSGDCWKLTV